jgi:hypothetical protein
MGVWYCTREDVKSALDIKETARSNAQIDRAIEAASRVVEGFLHRTFAPITATRYFDWPNLQYARAWRLWLNSDELISVTTLTSGGTTISSSDYFLEPVNSGPPYDRIEIDLDSSAAFSSGDTHQRSVAVTGVWGYENDETTLGATTEALDSSETGVDVDGATAAQVGVGSVLKVDSERMLVTERTAIDTTQNLQSGMTDVDNDVIVDVTDGTAFAVGEILLIESERMRVVDIAGNNLTVIRAWDGSVLAAHSSSADVYAYRTLTVTRGALGTTAAAHNSGSTVYRWNPPGPVRELAMAEAANYMEQALGGYVGSTGSEQSSRAATPVALAELRASVRRSHGRKGRLGAV